VVKLLYTYAQTHIYTHIHTFGCISGTWTDTKYTYRYGILLVKRDLNQW